MAQAVNDSNFKQEVLQADRPVLVDFWAAWCGPCKMLGPVVEELAVELGDKVKVVKLDVDQNQSTAINYGVMSIPTLILFDGGREQKRLVGFQPKEQLKQQLEQHIQ